jgi:hypothetical protein
MSKSKKNPPKPIYWWEHDEHNNVIVIVKTIKYDPMEGDGFIVDLGDRKFRQGCASRAIAEAELYIKKLNNET